MKTSHYLMAIAAGALLWAAITPDPGASLRAAISPAPKTLTEDQKQQIVQRLHTEIVFGQLLYDLPMLLPPTVSFELDDGGDRIAESVCKHADLSASNPTWELRVDPRVAAGHWKQFLTEALPHEAAHLLLCQLREDWTPHDDRWRSVVRELGAEPKEFHRYE